MMGFILVLFFLVVVSMLGACFYIVKKNNGITQEDSTEINTTKDFIPFKEITNSMIELGNFQYRAIIECSSINYYLQTATEQEMVEASFQEFVNSLEFPISIYIQTKLIDNQKMLDDLEKSMKIAIENFGAIEPLAEKYFYSMQNLNERVRNNKEKKKYIIISYDDAITLTNLTDEEKYLDALTEMETRSQMIADALSNINIHCKLLNTKKLIDLFYSVLHKDMASQSENLNNNEFLSLIVNGNNKLAKFSDTDRFEFILYSLQKRIQTEMLNDNSVDAELKNKAIDYMEKIGQMRADIKYMNN